MPSWNRKDLLGLRELEPEEIILLLDRAVTMKQHISTGVKNCTALSGKTVMTMFYENSTRTRMSFELAARYLSAHAADIPVSASSVLKGETLIDTGKNLDRMAADVFVIRHSYSGAPSLLAKHVKAGVVNAGDGMNEHPTQALLDMMTIREYKGGFEGLRVAIVGDILHSRVARSNAWGLPKLGASVVLAGPATLLPVKFQAEGVSMTTDAEAAVRGADVVMALRIQKERQKNGLLPSTTEYSDFFGITEKMMELAKPDAIVMHPGPVNRGVELPSAVCDAHYSVILPQVTNGVAVRMAVLDILGNR